MQQAGRHQRTPGGLLLPMRATLKGRIRWQVLDERGIPEVPRNPSGFPLAPAEGVEQPNLITDLGLDQIAAADCFGTDPGSSATWRRYLAVGTGSAAPSVGDTTLAAEVQRAASSGSFSNGSTTYELDDTDDVWRAESLITRLVTMNADRNIAEFGLSPESSGAIGVRELLRDGEGDPITVSLLNGKTLRVDHTLTVELPAPEAGTPATINIAEYDAGNNLIGTTPLDVVYGGHVYLTGNEAWPFNVWNPSSANIQVVRRITSALAYARQNAVTSQIDPDPNTISGDNVALEAYVAGTHQRIKRRTIAAGSLNAAWYGFIVASTSGGNFSTNRSGWLVLFTDPASYTKQNTDTLRLGLVSSWARAA
ncbi:MAG TPA: hypothetical protein VF202_11960 [Trueperaceae bacterium]